MTNAENVYTGLHLYDPPRKINRQSMRINYMHRINQKTDIFHQVRTIALHNVIARNWKPISFQDLMFKRTGQVHCTYGIHRFSFCLFVCLCHQLSLRKNLTDF